jgi:IS4 transposase
VSWVVEECGRVELGDVRLDRRLWRMLEALTEHAEESLPQALGSWAETKGAYRLLENPRVSWQAILAPHCERTVSRAQEQAVVLVAQDTTEINLTSHPATEGLGYLASPHARGVLVHTCLAVTTDGVPLGTIHQQMWVRPLEELGKTHTRRQKATVDKESQRWLNGLEAVQRKLAGHRQVVLLGDRESDIYDLFAAPRSPGVHLLVRVAREGRRVEHPERYLDRALAATAVRGLIEVEVPRKKDRPPRLARLTVRWATLALRPPKHRPQSLPPVALQFVLVEEVDPPPGEEPIRWLLATTLPVESLEEAVRCVQWYVRRWVIERFHFTLKSGYQVEQRRFEYLENVQRALATFSIAAWRVLWLTLQARQTPEAPCTILLSQPEWQALHAATHRRRPQPLPSRPPTLGEAVKWIAQLGGHLGRKGDGPPGVKVVWRGLSRLSDITTGWLMAHAPP